MLKKQSPARIAVAFLILASLRFALMRVLQPSGPLIVCDESTFAFGNRHATDAIEHLFVIKNAGRLPLLILDVKTSCVCTVVPLFERTISSGKMAIIPVRLNLAGHEGKIQQSAVLKTNDLAHPYFLLKLVGTVSAAVGDKDYTRVRHPMAPTNLSWYRIIPPINCRLQCFTEGEVTYGV